MKLADAKAALAQWEAAEAACANAQSYTIAGRVLTRASLPEIAKRLTFYRKTVEGLESGRGAGIRVFRVMPRDF